MAKKFNNRRLSVIFLGLVSLMVITWFLNGKKNTFSSENVKLDSAAISSILFYPKSEKGKEISLVKSGKNWSVSDGKISEPVDSMNIREVIRQLLALKADRLVANTKDKWAEYEVTDTASTRIKVMQGDKIVLDVFAGKFDIKQGPPQNNQMGGQPNFKITSYFRYQGSDEVNATEDAGLSFMFNKPFSSWRNQSFLKAEVEKVNRMSYKFPGNENYSLEKKEGKWKMGNSVIDSMKIMGLLGLFEQRNNSRFFENKIPPGVPTHELNIEGEEMPGLSVSAWKLGDNEFVLNSSINPKAYFVSDSLGDFSLLFKPKTYWVGKK